MAEGKKKPSKKFQHKHVCFVRFVNFIGKTFCWFLQPNLTLNGVIKAAEKKTKLKLDEGPLVPAERQTKDEKEAKLENEMMKYKTATAILFRDLEGLLPTFSWLGRRFAKIYFQRHMENRLRIIDYVRNNYESLQSVKIEKPVFVVGVPRTGTTFTLYLLSGDPNNRYMPLWQGLGPTLEEKTVRRKSYLPLSAVKKMLPHLAHIHNLDLDEPEEDMVLLDSTFDCLMNLVLMNLPNYKEYMLSTKPNWNSSYRFHKYCLQILQQRYPYNRVEDGKELKEEKQWMLKAPVHLAFLEPLLNIYPDARIVWTHRDLTQSSVSMMSLLQHFRSIYCSELDLADVGEDAIRIVKFLIDEAEKFRAKRPEIFHDLYYDDLMKDPKGEMKKIYDKFGIKWTKESEEGISKAIRDRPKGKHGAHQYYPATYGYTDQELEEMWEGYHAKYKIPKRVQKVVGSPMPTMS